MFSANNHAFNKLRAHLALALSQDFSQTEYIQSEFPLLEGKLNCRGEMLSQLYPQQLLALSKSSSWAQASKELSDPGSVQVVQRRPASLLHAVVLRDRWLALPIHSG